ncbi:cysteine rich repeat-containing protein [Shumkonia mesophila]|uniref:cysteine rich repeat-containing protein n=1 Tax=Shumkonia mesophila TaxID=2838854 RepID=UPI0029347621|nr:cysteine rich repeat-containing protein [Shumkonia mesophila]
MFVAVPEKRNRWEGKFAAAILAAGVGLSVCTPVAWAQQQDAPAEKAVRQACTSDFRSLCSGVRPGGGRILACLQKNEAKLSSGCRQALANAKAAKSNDTESATQPK